MRKQLHSLLLGTAAIGIGAVAMAPTDAEAGAFALREQSAYSQGASFAGAATCGDSIQGAFWNPAVVTCAEGFTHEGSWSLVMPSADITTRPFPESTFGPGSPFGNFGDPGDVSQDALIPSSTTAFNVTDRLYFGVSVNSGFGLSTKSDFNNAAQVYGRSSEVFSINAQPTIGYRVNDMLAVAAGLQIQYFDVRLTSPLSPAPDASSAILTGDDTSVGATAGILFTPTPWTEIGLGYRSQIEHTLEGTFQTPIPITFTLPIESEIKTPDSVSFGIRQKVTEAFTLLGTVEWTNWSVFSTFPVTSTVPGVGLVTDLPFEYDDGWFYSVGGEFEVNDKLTVRAGVGWEDSPISDRVRTVRLPDNDRLWLSAGMSYGVSDRLTLNAGYSFLHTSDTEIEYAPGHPDYTTLPAGTLGPAAVGIDYAADVDSSVHIVSLGLKYSFGGAPEPAMEDVVYKP